MGIATPPLCSGCRRLFIDYSKIAAGALPALTAHGHAYFRLMSFNPTYTVAPTAHSPNIKNLTNDSLVAPPGSPLSVLTSTLDPHLMTYAADTANFAHTTVQGPYYVGPWYVNTLGQRIDGAYLDVNLSNAVDLATTSLDDIVYATAFDSAPSTCLDAALLGSAYADGNYFYAGCLDWFGGSSLPGIDPWPAA
ncbi:MAG: hypothetical protein ACRDWB_12210 [Acidimicrobiales bacterium]